MVDRPKVEVGTIVINSASLRMALVPLGVASLASAAMLIACIEVHPYGYYRVLRWVVMSTAVIGSIVSAGIAARVQWLMWIPWVYGMVAVVFNPFAAFHMKRATWLIVDLIVAAWIVAAYGVILIVALRKRGES